jgi:sensor c-di-GMP phosphodiesterase-like protein
VIGTTQCSGVIPPTPLTILPLIEYPLLIDQSFVRDAFTQESSRIILKSSIEMAKTLIIRSVAEGVETQVDLDLLLDMGRDFALGHSIAMPMEAEAYLDWVQEQQ